jgi:two-component system sensor histidine kinase/response regulator
MSARPQADIEERRLATILAVDDNPANLLVVSAILETLGRPLLTASSGNEALALLASHDVAVILLDVVMPEMDGFETLRQLRAQPRTKDTPVILLTAFELDAQAMTSLRGTFSVDYVLKPFLPELLRGKVAALTALWEQRHELARRSQALAAKDRDIAMLAHDLQNPLNAIGISAALLGDAVVRADARPHVERIKRTVTRMSEMIRSLTDYARAGQGAIPVVPEPMDVGDLCREVVDDLRGTLSGRTIDIDCEEGLRGQWDRNRLHQAVSNLLGNAIRHGTGNVELRARGDAGEVTVSVHNGGRPIPSDLLPVIFQPFERGRQAGPGLGLGLFIVREIAKAHGGSVAVTSSAKEGTTFVLRLPREQLLDLGSAPAGGEPPSAPLN